MRIESIWGPPGPVELDDIARLPADVTCVHSTLKTYLPGRQFSREIADLSMWVYYGFRRVILSPFTRYTPSAMRKKIESVLALKQPEGALPEVFYSIRVGKDIFNGYCARAKVKEKLLAHCPENRTVWEFHCRIFSITSSQRKDDTFWGGWDFWEKERVVGHWSVRVPGEVVAKVLPGLVDG